MNAIDDRFRMLIVCTGNICRSPQAERLFQMEFARQRLSEQVVVSSAGTAALVGRPMEPQSAELTVAYGGKAEGHSARRLEAGHVESADLVLTMERSHRADVVRIVPRASRFAFTLPEFVRLLGDLRDSGEVDPADLYVGTPERLRALIPQVAARRGMAAPSSVAEDEIEDPYRRSDAAYARSASQIASAVATATTLMLELAELQRTE